MRIDEMLPSGLKKALKGRMLPKEKVGFALPGFTIFRSRGRWIWPVYFGLFHPVFLLATNRRIIVVAKGLFRTPFYSWGLSGMSHANFEEGWLADRVTITEKGANTHVLFPTKVRTATKQLVHQVWQLIANRTPGKRRRRPA